MPDSTPHIASPTDLAAVREIVLGNIITSAETPSPTFGEEALAAFITNRFKELELTNISIDEAGNAAGLLLGSQDGDMEDRRTILVVAHTDKIWPADTNHTADVGAKEIVGRGIADNSVGVGALISLPKVLKELGRFASGRDDEEFWGRGFGGDSVFSRTRETTDRSGNLPGRD